MYVQGNYEIISRKEIAKDMYDFEILCKDICDNACPGQFVHISVSGFFLRRPISICDVNKEKGILRIAFQIKGNGTKALASLNVGDKMDIMGPLGNGFKLLDKSKKAIVVGGGIGTPPMLYLGKYYGDNARAITGFRNKELVILQEDYSKSVKETFLCTDDGSAGDKGFVTDALENCIKEEKPDVIYACGPLVMLKGVAKIAKENNIFCEISLEERMACGVGACLGCAVKLRKDNDEFFGHVCKDGPVFDAEEVVL